VFRKNGHQVASGTGLPEQNKKQSTILADAFSRELTFYLPDLFLKLEFSCF